MIKIELIDHQRWINILNQFIIQFIFKIGIYKHSILEYFLFYLNVK